VATVDVLTDVSALAEVEPEWRALAESRGNAFVSPEWYHAWLPHLGPRAQPWVLVLRREDGALQGVIPLVASIGRRPRRLRFAGGRFGDYFHPVSAIADEDACATVAAQALRDRHRDWAILVLDKVDVTSSWVDRLRGEPANALLPAVEDHREWLPYIDLSGLSSWEEYLATRSKKLRSQLGRELRVLERDHSVRFRRTLEASELEADVESFFDLHERRWTGRGRSTLAHEHVRAALADFAAAALAAGWLRLWFLEVDGHPIASWYGWRVGPRYGHYQSGLDPAWSRRSAGLILLGRTIRDAIEDGAIEYDMLGGGEEYKRRFETGRREAKTIVVTPRFHPVRGIAAAGVGARRLARRLRAVRS
jgi:CelD/BcsL family acetyltransferase involved in cellulose biosynthesis